MGLTNFILTVAGVGAVVMLLRSDVKQSATVFRRNVKHIRNWLEEESSAASKAAEFRKPKEIETKVPGKDIPKEKDTNVRDVCYRPPGTELNILNGVNLSLREKSFGLIFGKSGSGKATLLQLLGGLNKPTSGSICIQRYEGDGQPKSDSELLPTEKVGIVFQFPERFFVADNVLDEITFGWPRHKSSLQLKEHLTSNLQRAFNWIGLDSIPLDKDPQLLSGGYKRRLALAIQLVQTPDLLILDEPLAGLDWKARADVAKFLKHLKKELTLLVVSHDLRELAALVDQSWRMETGGVLLAERPPV